MHRGTISYDQSVWLRIVGNRDNVAGGGRLDATSSLIQSLAAETQGIQLIAGDSNGGRMKLNSLTLESPGEKVLLAQRCEVVNLQGAPERCEPLTEEDLAAQS